MLSRSIEAVGVKEPLTVYTDNGTIYVSDGHCRLKAAMLCIERGVDLKTVPVKTGGRGESEADRVAATLIRNSGKKPTPLEQSRAVKRLVDLGWQIKDIAAKVGLTVAWANELLDFNAAPEDVKALVANGTVSSSVAMKATKEGTTEKLREAAKTEKRVTAKHMRTSLKAELHDLFMAAARTNDAETVYVAISQGEWKRLQTLLGMGDE